HLLNHTSGIRDYLMLAYLKGLRNDDFYTDEELMQWLVNQTDLNFVPGEEYVYSNSGYWLLGQIVKEASGKNMADFAQEAIFEPLGMEDTHFHNDHTAIVKNRASGYTPSGPNSYAISMTTLDMIGDGGIFTTINDIKKWDDAFYESEVLSKEFWTMMTRQGVLNNGEEIDYASGLEISEYRGLKTIRHGGAFVGFRADLLRFPEQKLTIAVFANRADGDPWAKADEVADILLAESFKDQEGAAEEMAAGPEKTEFINLSRKQLEGFTGHYWNPKDAFSREIVLENDTLRYVRNERSRSTLVPVGQNEFKIINIPVDVRVQFVEAYGTQMAVTVEDDAPSIFVEYEPVSYQAEALKPFVGTYYSQELDVEYVLKLEEGKLMLYLNGNPTAPLDPIMKNVFSNDYYGVLTFAEKQGVITEFRLAAGRVKNLLFTKR
ncbi:MAG: serine hydrolase domain-containing protein, partial [Bacteroidota bacterium]